MTLAAKVERLDRHLSVKTFGLSFALLLTAAVGTIIWAGITGDTPRTVVEKTIEIPTIDTVAVKSGDLNQLDLKAKPPKGTATEAGKPQPRNIEAAIQGLYEKTPFGNVPIVRENDGLTPFKAYSAPFAADMNAKARISFLISDFGLSEKITRPLISDFPSAISFMVSPYLKDAQKWMNEARIYSHEVWLSVPVQGKTYPTVDTGPNTILHKMDESESNARLLRSLGTATGYSGVVIDNLDAFGQHKNNAQKILSSIAMRGLGILQTDPNDALTLHFIGDIKAPTGMVTLNLDTPLSDKDVQNKLIEIGSAAVQKKKLIVLVRPYPATIKALQKWFPEAENRGIQLAPVSAILTP